MLTSKKAPGTAPEAEQSQDDTEQTEVEQEEGAEAPAPAPKKPDGGDAGTAPKKDEKSPDGKAEGDKADEADDFKAKYDDTEAKRRDIQSKHDTLKNENEQLKTQLGRLDQGWRSWIERNAPEAHTKLTEFESRQKGAREGERSVRADSDRVVLGVYQKGDKDFGDYLSAIADDGARITSQSLDRHRATFDRIKGTRSAENGNGKGAEPPRAGASAAPAPASPPRVPGAGRPNAKADTLPEWKPGDPLTPRKLIGEGLKERRERAGR